MDIPAADYASALVQAGLDEGFAGLIAQWDVDASNGALFSEDKTLEKIAWPSNSRIGCSSETSSRSLITFKLSL